MRPAERLSLAAAPVFAVMAGLTEARVMLPDGGPLDVLCAGMSGGLPLGEMSLMYLLMALFHLPPWLRLLGGASPRPCAGDHSASLAAPHRLRNGSSPHGRG